MSDKVTEVSQYLTKSQLAARWEVSTKTLENYVKEDNCPPPIRFSKKHIRWKLSDVIAWERAKMQRRPQD